MQPTIPYLMPGYAGLRRPKRWLALLALSVAMHLIALQWAGLPTRPVRLQQADIVSAELLTVREQGLPAESPHAATRTLPPPRPDRPAPAKAVPGQAATSAAPSAPATEHGHFNLPPSVELTYDVIAIKKGSPSYGKGTISWQSDGSYYRISGTTDLDGIPIRSFQSEGTIDQFGIAPLLYTEKSRTKSATNTHFQHERNIISFSSSTASYPRHGGEQDRASIIWQLVAMARGNPGQFVAGASFDLFVAGVREGDTWRIQVLGEEEAKTATGTTRAWHLVRMPRDGTYEQRLDVWLAPQHGWHPVQLRYTQVNGDSLEMSLNTNHAGPPPATH